MGGGGAGGGRRSGRGGGGGGGQENSMSDCEQKVSTFHSLPLPLSAMPVDYGGIFK